MFQEEATAGPRLRSQLGKEKTREEAAAKCRMREQAWSAGGEGHVRKGWIPGYRKLPQLSHQRWNWFRESNGSLKKVLDGNAVPRRPAGPFPNQ